MKSEDKMKETTGGPVQTTKRKKIKILDDPWV